MKMYDCIIIGCGIIGAAAAYELSRYRIKAAVLEKSNDVAAGATKANSAIIHAGYDPEPGSKMARLNVEGARLCGELARALGFPYRRIGSMVLAFDAQEREKLRRLYENGRENGVPEISLLDGFAARALEPSLAPEVCGALLAPTAAIVSPWEYALALAQTAVQNGVEIHLESVVRAITPLAGGRRGWRVESASGVYETRFILNAAGVHSAEIHQMAAPPAFRILPSRGEYYLLDKEEGARVGRVIFQCPGAAGKGVLVSPTVHGNLIVGPNAEDTADGDDTATTARGLAQVMETVRRSVPSINFRASIRNFSGVRAVSDQEDFIIGEAAPGFFDLAGIKSPGLSAAPAVAREAARLLERAGLLLCEKREFITQRRPRRFCDLTPQEKNEMVRADPRYGRVICRCETVTEGEIVRALHAPIPPCSVDGVKRRTGAGMGRCQGGFCGPRVLEIIARERGMDPAMVLKDAPGTVILTGETKTGRV